MRNGLYYLLAAILLVCLGMTVGCGAPQITIPSGQASVLWGQMRSDYAVAKVIVTQGCAGGKFDKASCDALAAIDLRAQTIRQSVEQSLMNASAPVDWGQVIQYSQTVAEMLIRLGLLAAK